MTSFFLSCEENSNWDRIEICQFINKIFPVPSVPAEEVLCSRVSSSWAAADPSLSLLGPQEVFSPISSPSLLRSPWWCAPSFSHAQTAPVSSPCLNKPSSPFPKPLFSWKSPTFPLKPPICSQNKAKRQLSSSLLRCSLLKEEPIWCATGCKWTYHPDTIHHTWPE